MGACPDAPPKKATVTITPLTKAHRFAGNHREDKRKQHKKGNDPPMPVTKRQSIAIWILVDREKHTVPNTHKIIAVKIIFRVEKRSSKIPAGNINKMFA